VTRVLRCDGCEREWRIDPDGPEAQDDQWWMVAAMPTSTEAGWGFLAGQRRYHVCSLACLANLAIAQGGGFDTSELGS